MEIFYHKGGPSTPILGLSAQRKPQFSLDRLLDQVSAANLHGEEDFGPAVGREVW